MRKIYRLTKEEITKAPATIGVYQFLKGRKVLYIGKAVNVKARLASHLQNARLDPTEAAIVAEADRIKVIPTESEFQALLTEAKLIKDKKPKYNKIWRDDKSYLYLKITREEYPKVLLARAKDIPRAPKHLYFGPFQSTRVVQDLIREVRKVVPFCTRERISRGACFHSKIGLCDPCPNVIFYLPEGRQKQELKKEYHRNIRQVTRIFKGQTEPVLKDLTQRIQALSEQEQFEGALILRNRMLRFEKLITQTLGIKEDLPKADDLERALGGLKQFIQRFFPGPVRLWRIEAYDVSNLTGQEATAAMVVLTKGQVDKSQYRKFKIKDLKLKIGDIQMLEEVVRRRFDNPWPKPNLIIVDGGKPQVRVIVKTLGELKLRIPVIGIAKTPDRLVVGTKDLPTIKLPATDPGFNLIRLIRDESHRFSRRYHLFLRGKKLLP